MSFMRAWATALGLAAQRDVALLEAEIPGCHPKQRGCLRSERPLQLEMGVSCGTARNVGLKNDIAVVDSRRHDTSIY